MNQETQNLLNEISVKLGTKPLIYFCREAERALGLENILPNYHICCVEDSYLVDQLLARNISIFCLEKGGDELTEKTTSNLLSNTKAIEWLRKVTNGNGFYALTFLPTRNIKYKIEQLGGTLLNIDYDLNQKFENKISQLEEFENNSISIPKHLKGEVQNFDYANVSSELGNSFVVQTSKDHTGGGTHFITSREEFNNFKFSMAGNLVRISQLIKGQPLTVNILINNDSYFISSIQYQITGIEELTSGKGSTVGNDFGYGNELIKDKKDIFEQEFKKISEMMIKNNYQGIFGVDLIMNDEGIFIIEINARQTANIPFQSKLELLQGKLPLMLMHIATFLEIDLSNIVYKNLDSLNGSQIFLRAKSDNVKIIKEIKSGIYRLQSDNAAVDTNSDIKENTIFLDEEKDMPLIFQKDGYSVLDVDGGFVLTCQRTGLIKNSHEELARMQFKDSIITNGTVTPWILNAFEVIEDMILH